MYSETVCNPAIQGYPMAPPPRAERFEVFLIVRAARGRLGLSVAFGIVKQNIELL
jgi:hypothetical protein